MKKKELEFNINGNLLEVADFTWLIDRINIIYISRSQTNNYRDCYSIFIETDNEIDRLYFMSKDIKLISKQFKVLCDTLSDVNSNFKAYSGICFNFANEKNYKHIYVKENDEQVIRKKGKLYYPVRYISSNGHSLDLKLEHEELKDIMANLKQTTNENHVL